MKKKFTFRFMLLLCALVVGSNAWGETVTYTVASTSTVSTSGTAPQGSSAVYSSTYGTIYQLTKDNSMTLTLSGYEGYKITGISLSMKSNSSKGAGSLVVTAGETTIASISDSNFNTSNWYGSWSTSYVDINVSMDDDSYEIQDGEDVVITIAASANSLYCQSFTLTYEKVTSFTITAVSNDEDMGTVSGTTTITAAPKIGYRVSTSTPYTIDPIGSATVDQNGNIFTVTPTANTTITINFETLPACTVTLGDDNSTRTEATGGAGVTLPSRSHIGSYKFAGWSTTNVTTETTDNPGIIPVGLYHPTADVTLYPVYIRTEDEGSETLAETMSYPNTNWNLSASYTSDQSTYTLFGQNGYVESTGYFNLATISKFEVTMRTYGGAGYCYIYIGPSKNPTDWLGDEAESNKLVKYTLDSFGAYDGTVQWDKIRVTSDDGNASNNGVGISEVKIYTTGTTYFTSGYSMSITKWTDEDTSDGWYLIASPVGTVNPITNVGNLLKHSGENYNVEGYDLYRFNQRVNDEWENWKQSTGDHYHFNLEQGKGYLYANSGNGEDDVTLTFLGTEPASPVDVTLAYSTDNSDAKMHGWNLIGNPFGTTATLKIKGSETKKPFYRMNTDHTGLIAEAKTDDVNAMEGIFVYTTTDGEKVTFAKTAKRATESNDDLIVIDLIANASTGSATVIDRAIVRFDEGETLPKFQLRDSNTKLYIPQNGKDYAIAFANRIGELPLNFKAEKIGEYTLGFSGENLNGINLVDKIENVVIDLSVNDSYSFIGSTTDRVDRFALVFSSTSSESDIDVFAYQSGNDIIVNGEGALEVYDVTGRKVMATTINGVQTVTGLNNGFYIFRLNEKTQKIVVR